MQAIFNRVSAPVKNSFSSPRPTAQSLLSVPVIWTRKTLSAVPSLIDQSFPKPLGVMLTGRNLAKLEKSGAVE